MCVCVYMCVCLCVCVCVYIYVCVGVCVCVWGRTAIVICKISTKFTAHHSPHEYHLYCFGNRPKQKCAVTLVLVYGIYDELYLEAVLPRCLARPSEPSVYNEEYFNYLSIDKQLH